MKKHIVLAFALTLLGTLPATANRPFYANMEICNRGDIDVDVMFARGSTSLWNDNLSFGWIALRKGRCESILSALRDHNVLGKGPNQTRFFALAYISVEDRLPVWLDKNKGKFMYETGLIGYDTGGTTRQNEGGFLCAPKDLYSRFAIEHSGWKMTDSCGRNNIRVPASNSIWASPNRTYTKATITIRPSKSDLITFDRKKYVGSEQGVKDSDRPSVNPSTDTLEQDIKDLKATVGAIAVFCAMFNCKKGLESIFQGGTVKKKHTYAGNVFYEGDWQNGEPNGIGTMTFPDGSVHTGQWKNGAPHGKVSIKTGDTVYTGDYRNGKANGWGQIVWGSNGMYEGEFKDGEIHGHGKEVFAEGDVYVGDFQYGLRNGHGSYTWPNGDTYTGAWVNNEKNGKGFLRYAAGGSYDGHWRESKQHGFGVETYANGTEFRGYFDQGIVNGSGSLTLKSGERCQGQWRDNKLVGQGNGWDTEGNRKTCTAKGRMQFKLN